MKAHEKGYDQLLDYRRRRWGHPCGRLIPEWRKAGRRIPAFALGVELKTLRFSL